MAESSPARVLVFQFFSGRAGDSLVHQLAARIEALIQAPTLEERTDAWIALMDWWREGVDAEALQDNEATALPAPATERLRMLIELVEGSEALRARFQDTVGEILSETEAVNVFADAGIPTERGFLSEFGDRLAEKFLPAPRDDHDLANLLRRVYRTDYHVERVRRFDTRILQRFGRLLFPSEQPELWQSLRTEFADGFRLLAARVQAHGLSQELRTRARRAGVSDSPFYRFPGISEQMASTWLADEIPEEMVTEWRREAADCREEMEAIYRRLQAHGVSVNVVYALKVMELCLTRMQTMVQIMTSRAEGSRWDAIGRLLTSLVTAIHHDRSLRHLVRANLTLLHAKIVERSGETGEHYVAASRAEYRLIWLAAAGGGLLTVFTAAIKLALHGRGFPLFVEGVLSGLNYAASFLLLQACGLILATKQPAMTAAALAAIIRRESGGKRLDRILDYFSRLVSSQLAAAIANVAVVSAGAYLFNWAWRMLTDNDWLTIGEVHYVFDSLSPIASGTVWYAALTGVLLWIASLVGGWFDNWSAYHRLPQAIAEHRLGARLGRERMAKLGGLVSRNIAGWGTNVSLGLLLGMTPAIGAFFGLPLDVRHVTLNSGILMLAYASVGGAVFDIEFLAWAIAGVGTMFVLNLGVSFGLALWSAVRAYGLPRRDMLELMKRGIRRLAKSPGDFVLPPRGDAAQDGR
jgi:site-specific recombinase